MPTGSATEKRKLCTSESLEEREKPETQIQHETEKKHAGQRRLHNYLATLRLRFDTVANAQGASEASAQSEAKVFPALAHSPPTS